MTSAVGAGAAWAVSNTGAVPPLASVSGALSAAEGEVWTGLAAAVLIASALAETGAPVWVPVLKLWARSVGERFGACAPVGVIEVGESPGVVASMLGVPVVAVGVAVVAATTLDPPEMSLVRRPGAVVGRVEELVGLMVPAAVGVVGLMLGGVVPALVGVRVLAPPPVPIAEGAVPAFVGVGALVPSSLPVLVTGVGALVPGVPPAMVGVVLFVSDVTLVTPVLGIVPAPVGVVVPVLSLPLAPVSGRLACPSEVPLCSPVIFEDIISSNSSRFAGNSLILSTPLSAANARADRSIPCARSMS
jgi:hypothetical protein